MWAVVKKHLSEEILFEIKGDIPFKVTAYLAKEFGQDFEIRENDEYLINIFDTDWYREISMLVTPGDALKIYRENFKFTYMELCSAIGKFTENQIYDMENSRCDISEETAETFSRVFGVPTDRFSRPETPGGDAVLPEAAKNPGLQDSSPRPE